MSSHPSKLSDVEARLTDLMRKLREDVCDPPSPEEERRRFFRALRIAYNGIENAMGQLPPGTPAYVILDIARQQMNKALTEE